MFQGLRLFQGVPLFQNLEYESLDVQNNNGKLVLGLLNFSNLVTYLDVA